MLHILRVFARCEYALLGVVVFAASCNSSDHITDPGRSVSDAAAGTRAESPSASWRPRGRGYKGLDASIRVLQEIVTRRSGEPQRLVRGTVGRQSRLVTDRELLDHLKQRAKARPQAHPLSANGMPIRTSLQTVPSASSDVNAATPIGIVDAYTSVAGASPGYPEGQIVVETSGEYTLPYYSGTMSSHTHATASGAGVHGSSMDIDASGEGTLSAFGSSLDTSGELDMQACQSLSAETSHHFHDSWSGKDDNRGTSDYDPPHERSCTPDPCGPQPGLDRLPSLASPFRLSGAVHADLGLQVPSPQASTNSCSTSPGPGGGSAGPIPYDPGPEYEITFSLWLDTYDAAGHLMSESLIEQWTV